MEVLHTFAEISVAVAGFASVVVAFKTRNKQYWNEFMFQGMMGHAAMAFCFSCLPFVLIPFYNESTVWVITSLVIGVSTFFQGILAAIFDKRTKILLKMELLGGTLLICGFLYLNISEIYFKTNIGPCVAGIFWHLFQSLLIFITLIVISDEKHVNKKS